MKPIAVAALLVLVAAFIYGWQMGHLGSQLELNRVLVNAPPQFDRDPAMRDAIRDIVSTALDRDPTVNWSPDDRTEAGHSLELVVGDVVKLGQEQRREVLVRLIPSNGEPPIDAVGYGKEPHRLVGSVENGFRDGWVHLVWRLGDDGQDGSRAHYHFAGGHGQASAPLLITRLGALKAKAAVEPLVALLKKTQDDEITLRLIGTLAQIGDDRAVEAMIGTTRLKDEIFMVQVVYAIGGIGGRLAEGFFGHLGQWTSISPGGECGTSNAG